MYFPYHTIGKPLFKGCFPPTHRQLWGPSLYLYIFPILSCIKIFLHTWEVEGPLILLGEQVDNSLGTGWGTHCQLEKTMLRSLRTWWGNTLGTTLKFSKTPTFLKKGEKKTIGHLGCILAHLLSLNGLPRISMPKLDVHVLFTIFGASRSANSKRAE